MRQPGFQQQDEQNEQGNGLHQNTYKLSFIQQHKNTIYCALVGLMIFTTALNLFSSIGQSQMHRIFLEENAHLYTVNNTLSLAQKIMLQYNQSKYNFSINPKSLQRLSYGQPRPRNYFLRVIIFTKKTPMVENGICLFTNGITIISNRTTLTGKTFLQKKQVNKWILFLASTDVVSDGLIKNMFDENVDVFQRKSYDLNIDSDYKFIREYTKQCGSLIYTQNNFVIDDQNAQKFVQNALIIKAQLKFGFVGFSKSAKNPEGKPIVLQNLKQTDLFALKQQKFNQYVYIISPQLYNFTTPLNFVYFNRWTLQQMLIFPILATTQKSNYLVSIQQAQHVFDEAVVQFKDFTLNQPGKKQETKDSLSLCFVGYPEQPQYTTAPQIKKYLQSLVNIYNQNSSITVVVHISYNFKHERSLSQIYKQVKSISQKAPWIRLKLRIHNLKAISSISVYESVYNFCPLSSLVVSSRYGVQFNQQFINQLVKSYSEKFHYYYTGMLNLTKSMVSSVLVKRSQDRYNLETFQLHFSTIQIFKSDLFKMIYMWALKVDELQFFQTEASFILPLIQMCGYSVQKIGNSKLVQVQKARKPSQLQYTQMRYLQKYGRWQKIKDNILVPIKFNSLTNHDLRRGTLDQIPRKIHQVWLIEDDVPRKIRKLQQTILQVNKNFEYKLWRRQDLTIYNFPLSYGFISKIIQYQQVSGRCLHRWMQTLFSYQVLYNYGGIYLGLKTSVLKPLDPFLKYELVFSGFYNLIGDYSPPISIGREVMGAKPHSYHMRFIIAELITEQRMNLQLNDYQALIGGDIIRLSMTNSEIYTSAFFGFNLFTFDPFIKQGLCQSRSGPCTEYNQAYVALHNLI